MATCTREELERMFESSSKLCDLIKTYCQHRHALDPKFPEYPDIDSIGDTGATIIWRQYHCSCHPPEREEEYISIDDLMDTDFVKMKEELTWRRQQKKEQHQREAEEAKRAEEARDREQLAILKQKYPEVK